MSGTEGKFIPITEDHKLIETLFKGSPIYLYEVSYKSIPVLLFTYTDPKIDNLYSFLSETWQPKTGKSLLWQHYRYDIEELAEEHGSISNYLKFYKAKKKELYETASH